MPRPFHVLLKIKTIKEKAVFNANLFMNIKNKNPKKQISNKQIIVSYSSGGYKDRIFY